MSNCILNAHFGLPEAIAAVAASQAPQTLKPNRGHDKHTCFRNAQLARSKDSAEDLAAKLRSEQPKTAIAKPCPASSESQDTAAPPPSDSVTLMDGASRMNLLCG